MIHPYVVGPMALTGFTWYQGEANTRDQASADAYGCLFPAMIETWRALRGADGVLRVRAAVDVVRRRDPEMRRAQMEALRLPMVGYATNADHGAGCNIHPPPKQYCGARLGNPASPSPTATRGRGSRRASSRRSAPCRVVGPPPPPGRRPAAR